MERRVRAELVAVAAALLAGCECGPKWVADVTLDFGEVAVGASSTKPLVIPNPSERNVELRSLSSPDRAFTVKFIAVTVPPNGSATFDATFTPPAAGAQEVELVLTSSAGTSRLTLKGVGRDPQRPVCTEFMDIDFGMLRPGEVGSRAVALPAGRLLAGDLAVFALSPSAVTFSPAAVGTYVAEAEVQETGCPAQRVTLRGQAATKALECVETPLVFGTINPGASRQRELVVQNSTDADVVVEQLAVAAPFSIAASTLSVPKRGVARLPVTFRPTLAGAFDEAVTGTRGLDCAVFGRGGGPDIDVAALDFGTVPYFATAPMGTGTTRSLVVRNTGDATLAVMAVTVAAVAQTPLADLALPRSPFVIPAQGQVVLPVKLTPSRIGSYEWAITFKSDDWDEPEVVIPVRAQAVDLPPCNYSVTPTSLAFGRVSPGEPRELTFSIRNLGVNAGETCLITALDLAPGAHAAFSLPGGPLFNRALGPGEAVEVRVRAAPTAAGTGIENISGAVHFGISSPTAALRIVPLTAQIGWGCLAVTPKHLQFGSVEVGCASSTRTVNVFNICSTPVTLNALQLPTAELTSTFTPGVQLPPRSVTPVKLPVTYRPASVGADTGVILLRSTQNAVSVDDAVTFSGAGNTDGANVDVFPVPARPKVDFLVVRDDSASMVEKQPRVADAMSKFLQKLLATNADFHLGVTYTEASGADMAVLRGSPNVLTPATPNLAQLFATVVNPPLIGGYELPSEVSVAALRHPKNAGLFRPDATLAVLVVTDDAVDPLTADATGLLERARGNYSIFGSTGAPSTPSCSSGGSSLTEQQLLLTRLDGTAYDACTVDWGPLLDGVISRATGTHSYFLSGDPDGPITVDIDGIIVLPVSGSSTVWTFDAATRRLTFTPSFSPGPGSTVRVSWFAACL